MTALLGNLNRAFHRCHTLGAKIIQERRIKRVGYHRHIPAILFPEIHRPANIARLTKAVSLFHP